MKPCWCGAQVISYIQEFNCYSRGKQCPTEQYISGCFKWFWDLFFPAKAWSSLSIIPLAWGIFSSPCFLFLLSLSSEEKWQTWMFPCSWSIQVGSVGWLLISFSPWKSLSLTAWAGSLKWPNFNLYDFTDTGRAGQDKWEEVGSDWDIKHSGKGGEQEPFCLCWQSWRITTLW